MLHFCMFFSHFAVKNRKKSFLIASNGYVVCAMLEFEC